MIRRASDTGLRQNARHPAARMMSAMSRDICPPCPDTAHPLPDQPRLHVTRESALGDETVTAPKEDATRRGASITITSLLCFRCRRQALADAMCSKVMCPQL